MSTLTLGMDSPVLPMVLAREPSAVREEQIRVSVRLALSFNADTPRRQERRRSARQLFPHPVRLTPLGRDQRPLADESIVVIGRHLSEYGLDFYHHEAIPFRRAVLSIPTDGDEWISLLFELFWTRYNCQACYDHGGKFLAVVPALCLPHLYGPQSA